MQGRRDDFPSGAYIYMDTHLFRLVNSPSREAKETTEKLSIREEKTIKMTLFSLQKFIRVSLLFSISFRTLVELLCPATKEEQFAQEFINHEGLTRLVNVIFTSHGNTLAVGTLLLLSYATTSVLNVVVLSPVCLNSHAKPHGARLRLGNPRRRLHFQRCEDPVIFTVAYQRLPSRDCHT